MEDPHRGLEREAEPGIEAPFNHVRVNVYSTVAELDRLVGAVHTIAKGWRTLFRIHLDRHAVRRHLKAASVRAYFHTTFPRADPRALRASAGLSVCSAMATRWPALISRAR